MHQQGTSSSNLDPGTSAAAQPRMPDRFLWVGSRHGIEAEVVPRAGLAFEAIDAAGIRGRGPLQAVHNLLRLAWGVSQAYRIIGRFQPNAILTTGGYVSAPVAVAGRLAHVPLVIYLPDVVPGLAIRVLARFAQVVAVSVEQSRAYLPSAKVQVTGYPVRRDLLTAVRERARERLGLASEEPVVLVFGGSRGARRINQAVSAALDSLLALARIVHVSGRLDIDELTRQRESLPPNLKERYHLFEYLHDEMIDALAAADLAVSRAGAATLGEFPARSLPAVLVPYPYAGAHQAENAAVLADRGAAVVVRDEDLTGERLLDTVQGLLADKERLAAMRRSMEQFARPDAAQSIAALVQAAATDWHRV
jgi:UDP-N-acetylglucosamine--N-acetylmuramyl-(pentapeptide) pyrophosphoryl-undecaprenol N-acetylglucosamine transferase